MVSASPTTSVQDRALKALNQLPPFSPTLNRLIASLAQEDIYFAKIAELIEKDTVLAGNVLRLVNSALFSLPSKVNSIRHAVAILGINKLRNTVLSMSVSRMWNSLKTPPGWSMARFNLHSVGTALLCDELAQHSKIEYAEGAFAAGLFHDLGLLLIATGLPEEYKQVALLSQQSQKWKLEYEMEVLGTTHTELSAEALAAWNLPAPIREGVRHMDHPEEDPAAKNGVITLSRVLSAADQYVKGMGSSVSQFESNPEDGKKALGSLGLDAQIPEILERFQNDFDALKPYF